MRCHLRACSPLAILVAACTTAPQPTPSATSRPLVAAAAAIPGQALDAVPEAWHKALDRGVVATSALGSRLRARVAEAMKQGGPAQAIVVCRDDAAELTAAVSAEYGIRLGRTSHRLRNHDNGAPPWMTALVELARQPATDTPQARAFDLGDAVGLAQPISTATACLRCHGPRDQIDPAVLDVLTETYPDDRATGFEAGSLRGYMWAEIPLRIAIE
ncbi:MAG: DUF3365 domain-containing protein [Pseudomonadota bacterium]